MSTIRPERSFESFSRGAELVRAIRALWTEHNGPRRPTNKQINANCEAVADEFDLTAAEWHHWCRLASHAHHYETQGHRYFPKA